MHATWMVCRRGDEGQATVRLAVYQAYAHAVVPRAFSATTDVIYLLAGCTQCFYWYVAVVLAVRSCLLIEI